MNTKPVTEMIDENLDPTPSRRVIRWKPLVVWILLFSFLGILGLGLFRAQTGQRDSGKAPDFEFTSFEGEQIRLSNLQGNIVVINFWASWCLPCREEASVLESVWRQYRERGVIFLGLNWADTEREAKEYLQEFGITYPNGPDLGTRVAQVYRMQGIPETFFIDRLGNLQRVYVGPLQEDQLVMFIDELLAELP